MLDAIIAFALLGEPSAAAARIGPSGLPVPRYASLKTNEVNARQGPSSAHRVLWVYQRAGLPLRITAESGNWRRIEDFEGERAWVHVGTLSPQRTALITAETAPLRASAKPKSRVRAWLKAGVVATLLDCQGGWRKLRIRNRTGWVAADLVWGTPACEATPST